MSEETSLGPLESFADRALTPVTANGRSIVVAREGDAVYAAVNRCPHLGFSLTRGPGGLSYHDCVVRCPWHNSRFDITTGENLDWVVGFAGRGIPRWSRQLVALGRTPRGLTMVPARVVDGDVLAAL